MNSNSIHSIHQLPGRLRVRVPVIRRNPQAAAEVEEMVRKARGVRSVKASDVTGSVLVIYEPSQTSPASILALLNGNVPHPPAVQKNSQPADHALVSYIAPLLAQKLVEMALERSFIRLLAAVL